MNDSIPPSVEAVIAESHRTNDSGAKSRVAWIASEDGMRQPSVRRWIHYLACLYADFRTIYRLFPKDTPGREGMKDSFGVATSAEEMLAIANHLFVLRENDVDGGVMECGCFKGFSTCCLSIACRRLEYQFLVADSFAGLPPLAGEVGPDLYYQAGDFSGSRREVEENLRTFGDLAGTELIEGWYSETLSDWDRKLSVLWIDVDLASSVDDILRPCLSFLEPRGAIFAHEFLPQYIEGGKIMIESGPSGAISRSISREDPDYLAQYISGNLAIISRSTSIAVGSHEILRRLLPFLERLSTPVSGFRAWLRSLNRRAGAC